MTSWDKNRSKRNKRDHGISFEMARLVFEDMFAVTAEDFLDENSEMRYQTIDLLTELLSWLRMSIE